MKVKTYGVPGLSEWHGKLKVGTIEVQVSFVGGTASPSGSQPAYMTTKDPITQFVVENSTEFKNGFIILQLTQEVAGVHPRMAVPKGQPKAIVEGGAEEGDGSNGSEGSNGNDGSDGNNGQSGTDIVEVEVSDKREAIEWLKERYPDKGYNGNNLRSNVAFEEACREAGVEFKIAE